MQLVLFKRLILIIYVSYFLSSIGNAQQKWNLAEIFIFYFALLINFFWLFFAYKSVLLINK